MDVLPEAYRSLENEDLRSRIAERKRELGKRLVILGHHYQRQDVIDFADIRGDSLALSRQAAAQAEGEFIVFCGVRFMAESAEILRQAHQCVQHPDPKSGCPLADMADLGAVEQAWEILTSAVGQGTVVPLTYMNSDSDLKAFCGRNGGAVCTSSNAATAFRWALGKAEKLIFFPDENLGRNVAKQVGIPRERLLLWDPERSPEEPDVEARLRDATVVLWKGFCHVHTDFTAEHVQKIRESDPSAKIVVHPECFEEVVDAADAAGSTEYICRYVGDAPEGSTIYVGTEINLVSRLALQHPGKKVYELFRSLCPNMFRIDLAKLLWTLDRPGEVNFVSVPEATKSQARRALDRMLEFS